MDASDIIKNLRDKTVFVNKVNTLIVNNPGTDVGRLLSSCCYAISSVSVTYPSYENKQEVTDGRLDYVCPNRN